MDRIRVWTLALSVCIGLSGCGNNQARQQNDCAEWQQTFEDHTQQVLSIDNRSPFNPLDGKQGHIAWLRRSAEFDREAAARFQRMWLRDPKTRQIRREMVVAIKAISANAQH